jgi:hypothetical protein
VALTPEGLSDEKGLLKSSENLGDSPFNRDYQMIPLSAKSISLDIPLRNLL